MKHLYLPIGREGYEITEEAARLHQDTGEIRACAQCSRGQVTVYH